MRNTSGLPFLERFHSLDQELGAEEPPSSWPHLSRLEPPSHLALVEWGRKGLAQVSQTITPFAEIQQIFLNKYFSIFFMHLGQFPETLNCWLFKVNLTSYDCFLGHSPQTSSHYHSGSRIYLQFYYMSRIIAIRLIFKLYVHTESLGLSSINSQLNLRISFCMSDVKLTKSSVFD